MKWKQQHSIATHFLPGKAYNAGATADEIRKVFHENTDLTKLPRERLKQIIQKFVWRIYVYDGDDPNDPDKIKIIMSPTDEAQRELDTLAEDYVALTDFLSDMGGNVLPLPEKCRNTEVYGTIFFCLFSENRSSVQIGVQTAERKSGIFTKMCVQVCKVCRIAH